MDKPNERKTITIKINGKQSSFVEEDKEKIEKQKAALDQQKSAPIHPTDQEAAAAKEQSDESDGFDWVLPKSTTSPVIEESKKTPGDNKKKVVNLTPKRPSFTVKKFSMKKLNLSTFLSIFFAVLLGTFFGLMLLKIVPEENVVDHDLPVVKNEAQNPPVDEKKSDSGTVTGTRKEISAAVVQEGIYSTKESASGIKEELNNKGIPAEIFSSDGQFALFVGVSDQVEKAKSIGNGLKSGGIDTYSKQWSVAEKNVAGLQDEEKKLLEASPQIYQSLIAAASSVNGTNKVSQDLMDNANKQIASLSEMDKEKYNNKTIIELHSHLEGAAVQLKEYNQKPQTSSFNKVQQHLLSFLANYQSL